MYQDVHYLNEKVGMPVHFSDKIEPIPERTRQNYYKSMSREIQGAAKFYIDQRDQEDTLRPDEVAKIITDMPIYAPYKTCFIQIETIEAVMNVLVHAPEEEKTADTDEQIYYITMIPYVKDEQMFTHDYTHYGYAFHEGDAWIEKLGKKGRAVTAADYTYWINSAFEEYIITDPDENGKYTNDSLEEWTSIASSVFVTLSILLNYPEITITKDVKGRANTTDGHMKLRKFTHSTLASRPSYEHKTLKLDMYGNNDASGNCGNNRSNGTAFHSVRKHIRKLPNGKTTFVKAHFRGSKDVGIVDKDYNVITTKR